jgi:hypothetical protein
MHRSNFLIKANNKLLIFAISLAISSCAPKPFKLVLMPDTQTYSRSFPEIFNSQAGWIAGKADSISFVLHQGDVTDNNSIEHWKIAANAFSIMEGKVPFTFVPGNHDIGTNGNSDIRNTDLMNGFMPFNKYSRAKNFGGYFEKGKMDNTWHTFKAGGIKWLIISLEFGPRNSVVNWAKVIVEKHPGHKVIFNTHAYMYSDNKRISKRHGHVWSPHDYGVGREKGPDAVNDGEELWEKLISKYPNVMFVFSGHVLNDGAGTLVSTGEHGNKVYQMLANYQEGVTNTVKGGNGYLRILTLNPKAHTVAVQTYSPYTNQYKTAKDHQFIFNDVKF